ncbi:LmbE family N-acetylglucosaminyl deacetylase [Ornithinimicrobium humiphilum]|uniref:LmbE family N-acetylglucosaminyl deacetylase n=1 Tax=Ornithinimicrobium humiphilum TaxID=125288 RepID=A0A543KM75_9MICO|nr:PIG-L deacetylase family protein [Ornithinimicrobium humiphilum]TQM96183.1 LmbE family N-acetylglucosaminyl deacetylase [Ornithinimicrobium humiphilum]
MTLSPFPSDWQRALCIAAHPDDLEYGTAGAVARWTSEGKEVTYLLVTRGEAGIDTMEPEQAARVREQEERDGAREVGVTEVDFLDGFPDGVVQSSLALRRALAREIRRRRPEVVVTTTYAMRFDGGHLNQADHRVVGLEVVDAVAAAGNRWIFPELVGEGFEPWGGVRLICWVGAGATHELELTEEHFEAAVRSLEAHQEYNAALPADFPSPRQVVTFSLGDAESAGDDGRPTRFRWTAEVAGR